MNQTSANLTPGATTQFTATVQNSSNTSVTWSDNSVAGGNSGVGTITSAGLYTAPSTLGNYTITATSAADGTKSASATVTIGTITVTPPSITLSSTTTEQFTATVQGFSNTAVSWSVDSISGGNATVGTITSGGLYTAPLQAGSHTVAATSAADAAASASAAITVMGLSISPGSAFVGAAGTQQFTANIPVTWSVDSISGGNATVGTITTGGLYTAPAAAGAHTIGAVSVSDSAETATASISVLTISISPTQATLGSSTPQQFTATVAGSSNNTVSWFVDNIAGGNSAVGTISASGLYTPSSQAGSHTIKAESTLDSGVAASASVSVFTLVVSPPASVVDPSATAQFTATIQGLSNTTVTWSVDGVPGGNAATGTVSTTGLYTAPAAIGPHMISATSAADTSVTASASITVVNVALSAVLTYHNDDARDGAYQEEVTLTPQNVTSSKFGKLLSYPVDGQVYAQPLYVPHITIGGTLHDVVFAVTMNNSVYAFDADATMATTLWHVNLGPPVTVCDSGGPCPQEGILSTPVIDVSTNVMYLVVETRNTGQNGSPFYLHAIDLTTGVDEPGSPVIITGSVPGTGGDSVNGTITLETSCYQRMGLALDPVSNEIYIPFGSCTHGWIFAYDKTTLAQKSIFNDTPDGDGGGLWAGDGAPAIDDTTGDLYLMSGVDELSPGVGDPVTTGYNDSFLRLAAADLSVLDFFTPDDNASLAQNDADLGSGANILVPDNSSSTPHEVIGGGKDGNIFVVNRDNMGGYHPSPPVNNVIQTVHTGTQEFNNIFSTPVYWNGWVYYHSNKDVLRAFTLSPSTGQLTAASAASNVYSAHGATASLSSNGATNGVIWDIDNSGYSSDGTSTTPCVLHAYDASDVATELYNSSHATGGRDTAGFALKFTLPTIANGKVFVPTANELDVYGLLLP